jgi:hypothetical protein
MAVDFDLKPTSPLSGIHLEGTVTRRFLINYAVPADALAPYLPPGAELARHDGSAWVSACFVNIQNMRPARFPSAAGMQFNYLIYRTRAALPFPDGRKRQAVLVLQPNINRPLFKAFGRITPGVHFRFRPISLEETQDCWQIVMRNSSGETLHFTEVAKQSIGSVLPNGSGFRDIHTADEFLLGVSYGGQWQPEHGTLRLFAETHDPWDTMAADGATHKSAFLVSLLGELPPIDHVTTMTDIPHYFAATGENVPLH